MMNGVDTYDQVRTTNSCVHKDQRVSMSMFDFILDSSLMPVVVAGNTIATTMMIGRKLGTLAAQNYLCGFGSPVSAKLYL